MKHKGFTLVELLVSIALISIISGISLANYTDIRTSAQMESDVNRVVIALRDAQSKALSPNRDDYTPEGLAGSESLCGISVQFSGMGLTANQFRAGYTSAIGDCSSANTIYTDTFELENAEIVTSSQSITYTTPFGNPVISPGLPAGIDRTQIVIRSTQDTSITRVIDVYESGLIDVQ